MEVGHLKDGDMTENVCVGGYGKRDGKKKNECKRKRNKQRKTDEVKQRANELE